MAAALRSREVRGPAAEKRTPESSCICICFRCVSVCGAFGLPEMLELEAGLQFGAARSPVAQKQTLKAVVFACVSAVFLCVVCLAARNAGT